MVCLRALNGALLAALRPVSNGIVADATCDKKRGMIFGRVQSALFFGMFLSTMIAVPMANKTVWGYQGWRVAFVLVGLISLLVSLLVVALMEQPPVKTSERQHRGCRGVLDEICQVCKFLQIPTFCVMIIQGIFGTIPWSVMGNMVLYLQKCGIHDAEVAILSSAQLIATIIGNMTGGFVADRLAGALGLFGRPLNAQVSVALGILPMYLLFYGIPPEEASFWTYLVLILIFGLLGVWAQSGTNFPVLSEIVPASSRSRVMAWEGALENSLANGVGPPTVAFIATHVMGYDFEKEKKEAGAADPEQVLKNARALGTAMAAVVCIPWFVTFLAYGVLYWSYPRDIRKGKETAGDDTHGLQCGRGHRRGRRRWHTSGGRRVRLAEMCRGLVLRRCTSC